MIYRNLEHVPQNGHLAIHGRFADGFQTHNAILKNLGALDLTQFRFVKKRYQAFDEPSLAIAAFLMDTYGLQVSLRELLEGWRSVRICIGPVLFCEINLGQSGLCGIVRTLKFPPAFAFRGAVVNPPAAALVH